MAKTPSVMIELGTKAPAFSLLEPMTGKTVFLEDFVSQPILVAFICNHCPYVIQMKEVFTRFSTEAMQKGLAVVAINANDVAVGEGDEKQILVNGNGKLLLKEVAVRSLLKCELISWFSFF